MADKTNKLKVTVTKEAEERIMTLQSHIITLCDQYKVVWNRLYSGQTPPDDLHKRTVIQQELNLKQSQIRSLDRLIKDEIVRGTISPPKPLLKPLRKCFCGDGLPRYRRGPCTPVSQGQRCVKVSTVPIHPSAQVTKEEFLDTLGLLSHQRLQERKLQSRKVERRRRTANNNPKYTSNGFLKLDDLSTKRSKRVDPPVPSEGCSTPTRHFSTPLPLPKTPIPSCYVCCGTDFNLSCETCTTKFHADCIKITSSKAPVPHRLPICPKCVQAANKSQRIRMQNRRSRPPPSIMHSPAKPVVTLMIKPEVILTEPLFFENANDAINQLNYIPTATSDINNPSTSTAASGSVCTAPIFANGTKDKTTEEVANFEAYSKKKIEVLGPKAKLNTGNLQPKTVRIARVRLNMKRSSDETPNSQSSLAANTSVATSPTRLSPTKQSALKWQNKLKPKHIGKNNPRRRITAISSASGDHICVEVPCQLCILNKVKEVRRREENEENSAMSIQNSTGIEIKVEKENGTDQTPLLIKNSNNKLFGTKEPNIPTAKGNKRPVTDVQVTNGCVTNPNLKTLPPRRRRKKVFLGEEDDESTTPVVTVPKRTKPRKVGKRKERGPKSKSENSVSMKKTILAMTAAANAVMSTPMKPGVIEDRWANDSVMQTISAVIAWATSEDYQAVNSPSRDLFMAFAIKSDSTGGTDIPNLNNHYPEPNDEGYSDEMSQNLFSEGKGRHSHKNGTDVVPTEEKSNPSSSCSMKGQISDAEEDETEMLLSLTNSPVPSWVDGDAMSKTELVEKMLLIGDVIEQQKASNMIHFNFSFSDSTNT